jgi:hypothetical protein
MLRIASLDSSAPARSGQASPADRGRDSGHAGPVPAALGLRRPSGPAGPRPAARGRGLREGLRLRSPVPEARQLPRCGESRSVRRSGSVDQVRRAATSSASTGAGAARRELSCLVSDGLYPATATGPRLRPDCAPWLPRAPRRAQLRSARIRRRPGRRRLRELNRESGDRSGPGQAVRM